MSDGRSNTAGSGLTLRRFVVSLVIAALSLTGGVLLYGQLAALRAKPSVSTVAPREYNVHVFRVECRDYREVVTGFGATHPGREVQLSASVAGEIVSVHPDFKEGRRVVPTTGENDALLEIDRETYLQRHLQAERRLAEDQTDLEVLEQQERNTRRHLEKAESDLKLATTELEKNLALAEQKIKTDSEVNLSRLEVQRYRENVLTLQNDLALFPARKQLAQARSQTHQTDLEMANLDLKRTRIRAPFAGILGQTLVEQGQHVRPGDPLVKVLDVDTVEVQISVALGDAEQLAALLVHGESLPAELAETESAPPRWHGNVVRISPQADELTRTVKVFVEVGNRKQSTPLLPGAFVIGRIPGPRVKDAYVIPRDAILASQVLVVGPQGEARGKPVRVRQTLDYLAVVEGLAIGDRVILSNLDVLQDGSHVIVSEELTVDDERRSPHIALEPKR